MVECYGKGVKYSLLLANTIIFLSGAVVLSLGIWTVADRSFMERLLGSSMYVTSAVVLIITGAIVAFISLLGSLGAYKEIRIMLKTYFIILVALLAAILTIGTTCFVFRDQLDDWLQKEMNSSMRAYGVDVHVTEAWDSMQTSFECCGISYRGARGMDSWRRELARFNNTDTGPLVPLSCCRSKEDDQSRRACQGRTPRKEDTFYEGCYEKMKSVMKEHMVALIMALTFAISIILFGLILSGTLYFIIGRKATEKLDDSSSSE